MKILLPFLILSLLSLESLQSQTCITFQEMEEYGLSMNELDNIYPNATHPDSTEGPFKNRQNEFGLSWARFYEELFLYCQNNGLDWSEPTYCFNKIYFSKKGEVQYWFFNFKKEDQIPREKQAMYSKLIQSFSKEHKMDLSSHLPFSQCASVTLEKP